ncbi:MAG: TIGR03960 family B12-binding radical SAM protein [Candidatus Omnitrophota bacterium]
MNDKLKDMLTRVRKPGRYIGCETNSVRKEHGPGMTSVLLSYPDTYEVGMSYLGLKVLYHLVNDMASAVCERMFAPWPDMEEELKAGGMRLFSLETKRPANEFDIVGFSLSYELTYTNVLNILHLGGINILSSDRGEDEPIVIAGGACCSNPEPMSLFLDAMVIGDGEEALPELIRAYAEAKKTGKKRRDVLKDLSKIKGVYVPRFYEETYAGSEYKGVRPVESGVPREVERSFVESMENAYYPVRQLVPLVQTVHDRMAVEIMRGCPNSCRFCQASTINRPVRLRSPKKIVDICRKTYANTGYERIALLSLSSVNYPRLAELVEMLAEEFKGKGVGLSIPSLRIDKAFYAIPEMIAAVRKAGLTFAVESPDPEIRRALAKEIDPTVLCRSAQEAFRHGWQKIKLYFMVGFPGSGTDEARKILELARTLSGLKKDISSSSAEVKVSVNAFVPKAHTAMQWLGMKNEESLGESRRELMRGNTRKIKVEFSGIRQSILEAAMARGNRKTSRVIHAAWKNGAKMDGWTEFFNAGIWDEAFRSEGLDMRGCAEKRFRTDDILPWDHIDIGVKKEWLVKEFKETGFNM